MMSVAAVVPVRLPLVEEDLRIGTAGPRVAHGPEVVLVAHALDPLGPHADLVDPELLGFVVGLVDGHPEAFAVEADDLRSDPAQVDDIPTMGLFSWMEPVDPKNGASP